MKKIPLTNIQRAYLIGRESSFELGGYSAHIYCELTNHLDPKRFTKALNEVIKTQPMLRAIVHRDGTQSIQDSVPYYDVPVHDWRDQSDVEIDSLLQKKRDELSHAVAPIEQWPMFSMEFARLPDGSNRLFVGFDLLIADAFSFLVLGSEMSGAYAGEEIPPLEADYLQFLTRQEAVRRSERYLRDRDYWLDRLHTIAPAPDLPYVRNQHADERFFRMSYTIEQSVWSAVKQKIEKLGVSASLAALSAYAAVLGYWCNQEEFTLNLPMMNFGRRKRGMERVIGDFTKSMLLTLPRFDGDLKTYFKIVQSRFLSSMKRGSYDGVEIMNDLSQNLGEAVMFPVVFTGLISDRIDFDRINFFGEILYGVSQTPQVKLDCQVIELNGALTVTWDYKNKYFVKEELEAMFEQFITLLQHPDERNWKPSLPGVQAQRLADYNNTVQSLPPQTLCSLMSPAFDRFADQVFLKDDAGALTFADVQTAVENLRLHLLAKGVTSGKRVAVYGERCAETVIAILAVVQAGAAYVPINPEYPVERRAYILQNSHCEFMLTPDDVRSCLAGTDTGIPVDVKPGDDAYVIYTSGSTGQPKGVVLSHDAVCNTLCDMNQRYRISSDDVFLGIASFGFDLSVYDVFGSVATGAKLVLTHQTKNMRHLIELLKKDGVTVWNSVPALMDLLVGALDSAEVIESVRLILLSGDWIAVDLPARIKKHFPCAEIVSLGGATEAAIWSMIYPIKTDMRGRKSVPYGYPMNNQQAYILDAAGNVLPYEVEGELYIGGRGVAKGYDNDPKKTAESFICHETFGRLYRTGDYAAMKREGYMEFRGRRDNQVQLHGYRVELGEIEQAIAEIPGIKQAIVQVGQGGEGTNALLAYVREDSLPFHLSCHDGRRFSGEQLQAVAESIIQEEDRKKSLAEAAQYMEILEDLSLLFMGRFFADSEEIDDLAEWMQAHAYLEKYDRILRSWLGELVDAGYMEMRDGRYAWIRSFPPDLESKLRERLKQIPVSGMSEEVQKYFFESCRRHKDILSGRISPLEIFFAKGESDIPRSIYDGNAVSRMMNELTAKLIDEIVADRSVKILELGAGIGGTSTHVLETLKEKDVTYVYTDISDFFLDYAQEKFPYEFLEYRVLDLDESLQEQGCTYADFDIVLICNALHDAKDIPKTLGYIREVLKRDGHLVVLETVQNKRMQKVSFGLLEGLVETEDFRKDLDGPMLDAATWLRLLRDSMYRNVALAIEPEMYAEDLWMNIFVAQNASGASDVSEKVILERLRERFPEYMIPAKVFRINEIPLSPNGKVDRRLLPLPKRYVSGKHRVEPETEMEKRLARLWEEHLKVDRVGVTDSFFELGGDSLKAIKLVTMAEKEGIRFELADLYQQRTIRKLAVKAAFAADRAVEQAAGPLSQSVSEEDLSLILDALESDEH